VEVKMTNTNDPDNRNYIHTKHGRFRVNPVIGFFDISTHEDLPFGTWTLKVVDMGDGVFHAFPNVYVFNSATKCIEHVCGIGKSVDEAILDAINMFMFEVEKQQSNKPNQDLDESDFVWLNWQPYVQLTMPPTF
jgi:hypothetical protein